ncbi:MAG TPA: hypothetical protein VJV23_02215 [Candidatus Polarisedimenticolia bacterium]|nr:hypothetical protein [Candidatus Polarisedimenticolia bacterium]
MPKYSRGVLKLLGALAVVCVLQPVASSLAEGTAGREFSRCIQACNDSRRACHDRCTTDCAAMFPNNNQQRNACISACKAICDAQSDDCKLICQAIKDGVTPTEP